MSFRSWFTRKRTQLDRHRKPERYWVERGPRIVGYGDLNAVRTSKQLATFEILLDYVDRQGFDRVADLGSNFSILGQLLFDRGYTGQYIAVENNRHALDRAAQALQPWARSSRLVNANIRSLPFADNSLRCVVMKDVLEHMEDFPDVFAEAARVTRHALIIGCFLPWHDAPAHLERHRRGFYLNRYRRDDVVSLARELGFKPMETHETRDDEGNPNEVVVFIRDSVVAVPQ